MQAHQRFDSTLGFPGEGPPDSTGTPWFLATTTTRGTLVRTKRLFSTLTTALQAAPQAARLEPAGRRLVFDGPSSSSPSHGTRVDTALGRFLKAHRHDRGLDAVAGSATPTPSSIPTILGSSPVPQSIAPAPLAFACPRAALEFTHPLPPVPAGTSLRRTFICHFGGLHGMDAASFEEVWKVAKNGYNNAYDAPFLRFHADFVEHHPGNRFHPMGIQPGDLVGFLRRERAQGSAHPSLKDASASISTACAQASDGQVQLGSQDSVTKYLKFVKQSEAPDRKERMIVYPDVARLIQVAWEYGPNGNLGLEQLKRKLVILLMVDTAARPSDIWRLFRTTVGKYRQIEFVGEADLRIRFYWPKEVDPFSSRTNATNTWFSQWVVVRGTTPASTDTVSCLRDFLQRSSDPEQYAMEYITQLASSVQPLIFAKTKDGLRQKCSVDHISVILKKAISQAHIDTMKPRHLRGASTSKIVLLSPDALSVAMGLGRWTTGKTFFQHYNAPVTLLPQNPLPDIIKMNGQQILRWGWDPTPPPGVTAVEYDAPFDVWVGKSIPRLGRISKFDDGKYFVARRQVTHGELMGLISSARGGIV